MSEATGELVNKDQDEKTPLPWWQAVGLAAVVGLIVGTITLIGQGQLPGVWNHLANTGGPWLVAAFFVGAFLATDLRAAVAGFITMLGCLLGYYVAAHLFVDASADSGIVLFWIGIAFVGGPLFGVAGRWWRDAREWRRVVGAALLGAAIIAEGAYLLQIVQPEDRAAGWVEIAVGVIVPLLLGRSNRERLLGLAALLPALLLGAVGFLVMNLVYAVAF